MPRGVVVTLSDMEVRIGVAVGVERNLQALTSGLQPAYGCNEDQTWSVHVEGACGELACAKVIGHYWQAPVNTFRQGGDVGPYQVRTRSQSWQELYVRPGERHDAAPYVLVRGRAPRYTVVGWLYGHEARRAEWLKQLGTRPPVYLVPDAYLHEIGELPVREPGAEG